MPHVVVLGSGFVGSSVASALAAKASVSVLDLPTHPQLAARDAAARDLILEEIRGHGTAAVVNTSGLLRGSDDEMRAANVEWPEWLVRDVLPDAGVRFVHLGSASEYGDPGSADPIPETRPADPSGLYGETKWAGSRAVLAAREQGLDAVVGRGFNLVGPNLSPVSPLHQFLTDVNALPASGGAIELWWPATVRDFILLTDLAEAVARLALADEVPDVVNLCSGVGVAFGDIVEAMAAAQGKPVAITSLDKPGIAAVVGDPARLREVTGLRPEMSPRLIAEHAALH